MRKNNGPNIDPSGTPAVTGNHLISGHLVKLAGTCYLKVIYEFHQIARDCN